MAVTPSSTGMWRSINTESGSSSGHFYSYLRFHLPDLIFAFDERRFAMPHGTTWSSTNAASASFIVRSFHPARLR